MKRDGFWLKCDNILPASRPLLLSSSILRLFELTKAISMPEKKAESNKVIRMINALFIGYRLCFIDRLHSLLFPRMDAVCCVWKNPAKRSGYLHTERHPPR